MSAKPNQQSGAPQGGQGSDEENFDLPAGLAFAGTPEEEEPQNLEDLDSEGAGGEGSDQEPEALTPEEVQALRKQLEEANSLLGRQGEELGRLRNQQTRGPEPISPVQAPTGPDPYEEALTQATERFIATGDARAYAGQMNKIYRAQLMAAGQFFRESIVSETRSETDFFAKNADLLDGTPRSIYEGELAKLKLSQPRAPAPELRQHAADTTRTLLQNWGWKQVDEDAAATAEGRKLQGPSPRRSRTGSAAGPATGMGALASTTAEYRRLQREHQDRSR